jgi:hypothetical protein
MKTSEWIAVKSLIVSYDFIRPSWRGDFHSTKYNWDLMPQIVIIHHTAWVWEIKHNPIKGGLGPTLCQGRFDTDHLLRIAQIMTNNDKYKTNNKKLLCTN